MAAVQAPYLPELSGKLRYAQTGGLAVPVDFEISFQKNVIFTNAGPDGNRFGITSMSGPIIHLLRQKYLGMPSLQARIQLP